MLGLGLTDQLINSSGSVPQMSQGTTLFESADMPSPTNESISATGGAYNKNQNMFGGMFSSLGSGMQKDTMKPTQFRDWNTAWQDIGGGDMQSTGRAGASMNLYLQKMLSNPAIMQLLQSRMGVSNG